MRISDWSSDVCSSDLARKRSRRGDHICAGRGGPCSACWGSSKPGLLDGRLVGSQKPLPLIAYSSRAGKKVGLPPSCVFSRNPLKWRQLKHPPKPDCPSHSGTPPPSLPHPLHRTLYIH